MTKYTDNQIAHIARARVIIRHKNNLPGLSAQQVAELYGQANHYLLLALLDEKDTND